MIIGYQSSVCNLMLYQGNNIPIIISSCYTIYYRLWRTNMRCNECEKETASTRHYYYGVQTNQEVKYININATSTTTHYNMLGSFDVPICNRCAAKDVFDIFKGADFRDVRGFVILGVFFLAILTGLGYLVGLMFETTTIKATLLLVLIALAFFVIIRFISCRNTQINWEKNIKTNELSKSLDISEGLTAFTEAEYQQLDFSNR